MLITVWFCTISGYCAQCSKPVLISHLQIGNRLMFFRWINQMLHPVNCLESGHQLIVFEFLKMHPATSFSQCAQVHSAPQRLLPAFNHDFGICSLCVGWLGVRSSGHVAQRNPHALPHWHVARWPNDCPPDIRRARHIHRAQCTLVARICVPVRDSPPTVRAALESTEPRARGR